MRHACPGAPQWPRDGATLFSFLNRHPDASLGAAVLSAVKAPGSGTQISWALPCPYRH